MNRHWILAMVMLLAGCGTMQNMADPSHLDLATIGHDSGIVIISTGAPTRCISTATFLNILPIVPFENARGATLNIDGYAVKSDFSDHQGSINAITLPAGEYRMFPSIANPYVRGVTIPEAHFSVAAGEAVYLGELFIPAACTLSTRLVFADRRERDLPLAISRNPQLSGLNVVTRIPTFVAP